MSFQIKIKAVKIKQFSRYRVNYNNQMTENSTLFYEVIKYLEDSNRYRQILLNLHLKYHLFSFKLQLLDFQAIIKLFEGLKNKYQVLPQTKQKSNSWCQHQRKVYIWFIIFYIYRLEENNQQMTQSHWKNISTLFFNKNISFLMFQYFNFIKLKGKICWAPEDDVMLLNAIKQIKQSCWYNISEHIFINSGLKIFKSPKHCRERFLNHLDDTKKRGNWTLQEDLAIFQYVIQNGKRWCKIVPILKSSRTEHMIKNRYNSIVSKYQKNKKERQETVINKIIKIINKQICSMQNKKQDNNYNSIKQQSQEQQIAQYNLTNMKNSLANEKIEQQDSEEVYIYHEMQPAAIVQNQNKQSELKNNDKIETEIIDNIPISNQYYLFQQPEYYQPNPFQLAMNNIPSYPYGYNPIIPYFYNQPFFNNTIYY